MKAALFASTAYLGPAATGWPVPVTTYSDEIAERSLEHSLNQFELADQVGFDWVTVAEHHYSPRPSITPNPMVVAGAMTQRVKRAKIALLGPTVPILNPVRVAEEFALLDTMTGGRVIAGMMRGTSNEYVTYNVNPAESRERFQEALQLIVKAWTEPQPFGWQGRYFQFRSVSIWPRPVQKPHPPIFMSGSSPESGEFAAKNRIKLGFAVTTIPLASQASRFYREQANAAGWDPEPEDIVYRVPVNVARTDEDAMEALRPMAGRPGGALSTANRAVDDAAAAAGYYGRDAEHQRGRVQMAGDINERIHNGQLLAGKPETVASQIRRIREEVGAGVLDLIFPGAPEQSLAAIELFGTKVLPLIGEI